MRLVVTTPHVHPPHRGLDTLQGVVNYNVDSEDDEELEALLVVRDRGKGANMADVSTNLDQEDDDGDLV